LKNGFLNCLLSYLTFRAFYSPVNPVWFIFLIWDRQDGVGVKLIRGTLSSTDTAAVLSGAGAFAVGDGTPGNWEIIQFTTAVPIGGQEYRLSGFLRGQAGTGTLIPDTWPVGSRVVVLNGTPTQINVAANTRGIKRHFRFGPASEPLGDPAYRYHTATFAGNGLRPYPIVHLRAKKDGANWAISWTRQTRLDGGNWSGLDVPLGEDAETYVMKVFESGSLTETLILLEPKWTGPLLGGTRLEIAQVSDRFGAGPSQIIEIPI
jgi:hypothetical protein